MDTLAEDKKSDYYRAIRSATSYRNHILELIDNIDGTITSLDYCPDFEKDELIMDINPIYPEGGRMLPIAWKIKSGKLSDCPTGQKLRDF